MSRKLQIDIAESLINAVQKREVLYNLRVPGYKNRNLTELAWKEVSDEVGQDVTFCRTTWAQLRSTFNRLLAQTKCLRGGSAGPTEPKWYLYHQMMFVKDHVAHGAMTGSLSMDESQKRQKDSQLFETAQSSPTNSDMQNPSSSSTSNTSSQVEWGTKIELLAPEDIEVTVGETLQDDEAQDVTATRRNDEIVASPSKKKRKVSSDGDPVQKAFLDLLKVKAQESQQEPHPTTQEDSELQVFKSLLPFYKQMTDRNKRVFVAKTTTLCMQLLDSQENH